MSSVTPAGSAPKTAASSQRAHDRVRRDESLHSILVRDEVAQHCGEFGRLGRLASPYNPDGKAWTPGPSLSAMRQPPTVDYRCCDDGSLPSGSWLDQGRLTGQAAGYSF
jgi:hypothetical protein